MDGAREASGNRPRGAPPAGHRLSRDAVLARAEQVIDRDGVAVFSLRALARELDVRPAALYNHVASLDDLLDAVTGRYIAGFRLPDTDGREWSGWLREAAVALHERLVEYPHRGELVVPRAAETEEGPAYQQAFFAALERAGLTPADAHLAWHVVFTVVVGEAQQRRARGPDPVDTFGAVLDTALAGLVVGFADGTTERSRVLLDGHRYALPGG